MDRETAFRRLAQVPPFDRPTVRRRVLNQRRRLNRGVRHLHERLGSQRYARPALFDIDRQLEQYVPQRNGFFVEAGANDGYEQSNTYYLERFRGWAGVLVEPIPLLYRECVRERPGSTVVNCALVPSDFTDKSVVMRYAGLMSLMRGTRDSETEELEHVELGSQFGWDETYEVEVPARTLTSVLQEAKAPTIDLMSLDAEGFEAAILRGLDFNRYSPRFLLVEATSEQAERALQDTVGGTHELVTRLSPYDLLYRRKQLSGARSR